MKISGKNLLILDQILLQVWGYPIVEVNLKLGVSSEVIKTFNSKIEKSSSEGELDVNKQDLGILLRIIGLICIELGDDLPIVTGYKFSEIEEVYRSLNNLLKE